jgi:hypothetical protein
MSTISHKQEAINSYRPIQVEIQKVIFLIHRAWQKDNLTFYNEYSPMTVLGYLEQADEEIDKMLWDIEDRGEQ